MGWSQRTYTALVKVTPPPASNVTLEKVCPGRDGAAGLYFPGRRINHAFAEWLIGRRGCILKRTGLPVVADAGFWQPPGQRHH